MQRWQAEWRVLEDRIAGLQATASMIRDMLDLERHGLSHDSMWNRLKPTLIDVHHALKSFHSSYGGMLPPTACGRLALGLSAIESTGGLGGGQGPVLPSWQSVVSVTPLLIALRAEVSASLVDPETDGRRRTERAFEHLSRSIVVDEGYRERWQRRFDLTDQIASSHRAEPRPANEIECERLGAVHLLLHGIWAFKSDAPGERTDLVLQEKLAITRTVEAAEALVLTEWKVANTAAVVEAKAEEGRHQLSLYGRGSLAATELATVRYVVLVTARRERLPDDLTEDGITYRFVNIAVAPDNPSNEARRSARRT